MSQGWIAGSWQAWIFALRAKIRLYGRFEAARSQIARIFALAPIGGAQRKNAGFLHALLCKFFAKFANFANSGQNPADFGRPEFTDSGEGCKKCFTLFGLASARLVKILRILAAPSQIF